jgi:hypothetical protein
LPIIYYDNPFIKEENGTVRLNTGKAGMAIDLQNGHIDAYDFKLSSNGINLSANPDNNNGYYFTKGNRYTFVKLLILHVFVRVIIVDAAVTII